MSPLLYYKNREKKEYLKNINSKFLKKTDKNATFVALFLLSLLLNLHQV
jgi:hypothetical protein